MKTLYFDCTMGAAGDMLAAALLELHPNPAAVINRLDKLIPGVRISAEPAVKCGITGTGFTVSVNGKTEESRDVPEHGHSHEQTHSHGHDDSHEHTHSHEHNDLHKIGHIIDELEVSQTVKENALAVYKLIAQAESHAHGLPVNEVHFHEVGSLDAVADIVAVCVLLEDLAPQRILASPVHTGSGQVRCAHGILPVPAPATAFILQGIPVYGGSIRGELCTPTGAALLKHFVQSFGDMPPFILLKTGYGMGKKDFEAANCIRALWGEIPQKTLNDEVCELVCALDDITGEALAFAQQILLENGALDVYAVPAMMKKGRSGFELTCLCKCADTEKTAALIFRHTTTLGIRERRCGRHILSRTETVVQTACGQVRVKCATGYQTEKTKAEYEDLAALARQNNLTLSQVAALAASTLMDTTI